ncbi:MAG: hypothetical protein HYX66_03065 [Ignavibacteria bacterium]|nr:hypothetical protein [Ignavibacteria bacterium]
MKSQIVLLPIALYLLVSAPQILSAQETLADTTSKQAAKTAPATSRNWMNVGLMGGPIVSLHSLNKTTIPEVPSCCPGYSSTSGGGFVFAGLADFVISDKFNITTRLAVDNSNVNMSATGTVTVRVDSVPQNATITYSNTSTFTIISLEPGFEYRVVGGLGVLAGLRVGLLTKATYDQKEVLDPTIPYDYSNGESGIRNAYRGTMSNTSNLQFGLFLGARYHVGLNPRNSIELVPEVQYAPLFTNVINDQTWSITSLRFMLGLSFSLFTKTDSNPLAPEH